MDTKSLQVFQHLAHSLHFAKTADSFHMSPSTLSRLVQRLEEELDCQLLERDNRRVNLTVHGESLLKYADQQLNEWHELRAKVEKSKQQLTGKLKLFCSVTAAYSHLPQFLDRFRQTHPAVEIQLTTGDAADAIQHINEGSADIAIAAKPEHLPQTIYFQTLAQIPLVGIYPKIPCRVSEQFRENSVNWQSIPFIIADHGPAKTRFDRWYAAKMNDQTLARPKIYAKVSGHEAIVSMVALGCGAGIVPQVVVETSPVKERVNYFLEPSEIEGFELGICCQMQKKNLPVLSAFFSLD